jgi:trimeric autotransporter adhesin
LSGVRQTGRGFWLLSHFRFFLLKDTMKIRLLLTIAVVVYFAAWAAAQQTPTAPAATTTPSIVPNVINYTGVLTDVNGRPLSGIQGVTFLLYSSQQGGAPLWMETQNVVPGRSGQYTVTLGATTVEGLPADLFANGEARWLAVQVSGQAEEPRVLLVAVPYALKAADAQTIGGLPPSAFVLATPSASNTANTTALTAATTSSVSPQTSSDVTTTGGTVNAVPLFTTTTNIQNSLITQIAKTAINVAGKLNSPATGTATATTGKNSQPHDFVASAFNSGTSTAVPQTFQWQAEPAGNDTATASGSLNLLFGQGTATPAETGLHISSNGQITFATGQTFPGTGTGNGSVTSVATGTGLTGGPITSTGTLTIDPTVVPTLSAASNTFSGSISASSFSGNGSALTNVTAANSAELGGLTSSAFAQLVAANTFTGNQTVDGNLSATGVVTGSSFEIGSNLFAFGTYAKQNAFLGFGGNTTTTGTEDTASGYLALFSNTKGTSNTATGYQALFNNTTGGGNTASGASALGNNTTGGADTAIGFDALVNNATAIYNVAVGAYSGQTIDQSNITGNDNTFLGSLTAVSTGTLTNSTAIGAYAEATESNALVLGGISGVNGATASVNVGIGTTAPSYTLHVVDNGSGGSGIAGVSSIIGDNAVYGVNNATSGTSNGGYFATSSPAGTAVVGVNTGTGGNDYAGYFEGNVNITGSLSKGSGSFKIDHPLDPANKYLYHSFVESPDMMNIYNGVVTLNAQGAAWITLPDYFEALNRDFRYQLTSMGRPQPNLYIAREISGNRFRISGGKPGGKVSWQVTGIRHDAYADAHRIPTEEEKTGDEQGRYLHPELFGASPEQAIGYRAPLSNGTERDAMAVSGKPAH